MFDRDKIHLWEGIEVEGRLRGLRTLFVGDAGSFDDLSELDVSRWPHVYFNQGALFKDEHISEVDLSRIISLVDNGTLVTISVREPRLLRLVPSDVLVRCHLVIFIDLPELYLLGMQDEINFLTGDGFCYSVTAKHLSETCPNEYEEDREV